MNHEAAYYTTAVQYGIENETLDGRQEVDLGRGLWWKRHGQLGVEQLEALFLGRQAEDLVLKTLVLLLQGVEGLQDLHNYNRHGGKKTMSEQQTSVGPGLGPGGWGWGVPNEKN